MRNLISLFTLIIVSFISFSCVQEVKQEYNFDFEKNAQHGQMPSNWYVNGVDSSFYKVQTDSSLKHGGQYSLCIQSKQGATNETSLGIACSIPAIYEGEVIQLKAYIKSEEVSNFIGLKLQIDGEFGTTVFDNMQSKGIKGTNDWKEYTVTLSLPENAKTIIIAPLLSGTGKIWVDDITLLINGNDFREAPLKIIRTYKATSDTVQFKEGSGITISTLNKQQIENLDILGKVWGFLKYYHPAVAKGDYNWDYELFRIMPKVMNAKNANERNSILADWVKKVGKLPSNKMKSETDTANIKMLPDVDWIKDEQLLGTKLSKQLIEIKEIKKDSTHYYVKSRTSTFFTNENPYSIMRYPDAGYRLLSLFRYWNMVQYYCPYRYLIGEDWKNVLAEFIPQIINAKTELEYQTILLKLIARVNDTHANIYKKEIALDSLKGVYYSFAKVRFIENKAVITESGLGASGLQKGDIIKQVNGKTVEQIIKEWTPITPASNEPTRLRNIAYDLLRSNDTLVSIEYERNSKTAKTVIRNYPFDSITPTLLREIYAGTPYKMLNNNIGYVNIGLVELSSITSMMKQFEHTKGIVIDLRKYPLEFPIYEIGEYLVPKPTAFSKFTYPSIVEPGKFVLDNVVSVGKDNPHYYKGKVAILVNEDSQSSGEYHAMAFRVAPRAKVVGSTTAGADGNVIFTTLPGGISTVIGGLGVYYPDGRETQRVGIVPDIEVKPTIRGIKEGKDEVLEKAIEWINEK